MLWKWRSACRTCWPKVWARRTPAISRRFAVDLLEVDVSAVSTNHASPATLLKFTIHEIARLETLIDVWRGDFLHTLGKRPPDFLIPFHTLLEEVAHVVFHGAVRSRQAVTRHARMQLTIDKVG